VRRYLREEAAQQEGEKLGRLEVCDGRGLRDHYVYYSIMPTVYSPTSGIKAGGQDSRHWVCGNFEGGILAGKSQLNFFGPREPKGNSKSNETAGGGGAYLRTATR